MDTDNRINQSKLKASTFTCSQLKTRENVCEPFTICFAFKSFFFLVLKNEGAVHSVMSWGFLSVRGHAVFPNAVSVPHCASFKRDWS